MISTDRSAVEVGVLTALERGPLTVGELAIEIGYNEKLIYVVLAGLLSDGFVRRCEQRPARNVRVKGWGRPQLVYALVEVEL